MVLQSASHLLSLPHLNNWVLSLFVLYVAPQNALLTTSVFEVGVRTFLIRLLFILISPGKVSEPFRLLFAMVSTYFLLPAPLHLIDLQG